MKADRQYSGYRYEAPRMVLLGSLEQRTLGGGSQIADECQLNITTSPRLQDPCPAGKKPNPQ